MLHPPNCVVWVPIVVLQQSPIIIPHENPQQNAKKSCNLDIKTSPTEGIKALAGLILIRFHLQKIAKRSLICPFKLPANHILKNLLNDNPPPLKSNNSHNIGSLTNRQRSLAKGHLIDSSIKSYGIFPSFIPLDSEFSPGHCIIDNFSNRFSFNLVNKKEKNQNHLHSQELDNMVLCCSSEPHSALMITSASIKNDIATSISHIHSVDWPLVKTVHHALFITSTEAELFAIRCSINQVCSVNNVSKIVVVTNSIYVVKRIFDYSSHPYQIHSAAILRELWLFFLSHESNTIEFWECPSKLRWRFHFNANKDSKAFSALPSYPTKTSWDFCKKSNCNDLSKLWKMTFQALDGKGNHFLDLLDDDLNVIEPSYSKGGP